MTHLHHMLHMHAGPVASYQLAFSAPSLSYAAMCLTVPDTAAVNTPIDLALAPCASNDPNQWFALWPEGVDSERLPQFRLMHLPTGLCVGPGSLRGTSQTQSNVRASACGAWVLPPATYHLVQLFSDFTLRFTKAGGPTCLGWARATALPLPVVPVLGTSCATAWTLRPVVAH